MPVNVVSSLEEFRRIVESDKVAIFDFWAPWCGPCKVISPIFEKFSEQFPSVEYYKVDVDDHQDIAQEVGIRAMPTFIAFKSGQKIKELVGAQPPLLQSLIQEAASLA